MKSEQVMLALAAMLLVVGCNSKRADPLDSPYPARRVWAVVPLRNESGSLHVNGAVMADHLSRQLENASNIDVLAVNRVLAAMNKLQIAQITTPDQAMQLIRVLEVDGLIVGTITAFDPYDPPKIGLSVELYVADRIRRHDPPLNVRDLSRAPTGDSTQLSGPSRPEPVSVVSAFMDASDPLVREQLQRYATDRGTIGDNKFWHTYRISIDLYSEFVSYVMSWRLLEAERQRLTPLTSNKQSSTS